MDNLCSTIHLLVLQIGKSGTNAKIQQPGNKGTRSVLEVGERRSLTILILDLAFPYYY